MAACTTLMTFMVRTPPNTRSVTLYGSWDNFLMPYAMTRDVRLGVEHWTGCHSFENIICDGNAESLTSSRSGGLKMGGTYWYYYKLDDEIEFHNSVEPATTRCPLLPGQLVNELHVPFALSGSRTRDASVSSTSSQRRTLDPEAKFVNPRPAPARPRTIRLNTSPTVVQASTTLYDPYGGTVSAAPLMQSDNIQCFWEPSSKLFHLPRKPSLDALLKNKSPKKVPAALRSPFQFSGPSPHVERDEKYQDIINWIPDRQTIVNETELVFSEPVTAIEAPTNKASRGGLLLRANSEEAITLASFREHRRQKSRSRSRERSNRNSLVSVETAHIEVGATRAVEQGLLSAVIEINTPEGTPAHGPMTGRRIALEALEGRTDNRQDDTGLEKRLPTLPNTPSSAYPPTQHGDTPARQTEGDLIVMDSHFSTTTIDTALTHDNVDMTEDAHSRYLQFANDNTWSSASTSVKDEELCYSPSIDERFEPIVSNSSNQSGRMDRSDNFPPRTLSSNLSYSTIISSSASTTPTTSYSESEAGNPLHYSQVTSIRSSGDSFSHYQHYSLPEVENASEITLKQYNPSLVDNSTSKVHRHQSILSHSEGMQQLLDELSYLSDMIQTDES